MSFKLWSDSNPTAKLSIHPTLGIKSWDDLSQDTKEVILKHFMNKECFIADDTTYEAVRYFAEDHKANNYCNHLLGHGGPHYYVMHGGGRYKKDCCHVPAQLDFHNILIRQPKDVVYELFSYYANRISTATFNERQYPKFISIFNDISEQFNLDILISGNNFIFRQEGKIIKDIYEPTLVLLSDKKWEVVSRELDDAFIDYVKGTRESYSSSITHAISGLQAFLQTIVHGKVGRGDIAELIKKAQEQNLIPNDEFSKRIFKESISILMIERQEKGDPHPKEEYANEKTTRLVLNLIMIFFQHCLQK